MKRTIHSPRGRATVGGRGRKGIIAVLASLLLVAIFGFVAFAVDTGKLVSTQTSMQNGVDAAALAASQELSYAIYQAGQGNGAIELGNESATIVAARQMAADVARYNGVFVDPDQDVAFGRRTYDASTGTWPIEWGEQPYNVVRVQARRTDEDTSKDDGQVKLGFGWAIGMKSASITASASAFIEARDMVLVLDFSGSMNDDSSLISSLGQSAAAARLDDMWDALVADDPKWPGTSESKFPSTGFGEIDSYYGTYVSSSTTSSILSTLKLNQTSYGKPRYPFPQSGRNSYGSLNSRPSTSTSNNLWEDYIDYVKNLSGTYKKRYGYRTLMDYLQERRYLNSQSEDLWRTPHYPFHAIKEGATLFTEFLADLDFGDELGLVSYGGYAKKETSLDDGYATVDISEDPITNDYEAINTIQRHKQAGHYDQWTGMGYGILAAREMLFGDDSNANDNGNVRYGSQPIMIIMTDGNTNQGPSNYNLPSSFSWADWTDYDGDGDADYYTNDSKKKYAFYQAVLAIQRGVTVHTMSVGAQADRDLMEAIAFAGNGVWINIPGGSDVSDMESQLLDAFAEIGAKVPPAKLVYDDSYQQETTSNDDGGAGAGGASGDGSGGSSGDAGSSGDPGNGSDDEDSDEEDEDSGDEDSGDGDDDDDDDDDFDFWAWFASIFG